MFQYIPKKSREIYNEKIAHRGFHLIFPENSIPAYVEAINRNLAIELDVRLTSDGEIICMHDRHIKRLLGKKGTTSKLDYTTIKRCTILDSKERVPKLTKIIKLVDGKVTLLIEIKGYFSNVFKKKLIKILENYEGKVYFHAKNIFTYYALRKIWKEKVFWILNPLRKRFDFIKKKEYKKILKNSYNRA